MYTGGTLEANLSVFYHHRIKRKYSEPTPDGLAGLGPDPFVKDRLNRYTFTKRDGYETLPEIPSGPDGDKEFDTDSNPLGEH